MTLDLDELERLERETTVTGWAGYLAALLDAAPALLSAARERDRLAAELAAARDREARLVAALRSICAMDTMDASVLYDAAEAALTAATGGEGLDVKP